MRTIRVATFLAFALGSPMIGYAQLQGGPTGGMAYNTLFFHDSGGNESPDLYGAAIGFTAGIRLQYALGNRWEIGGEFTYQCLPYTIKFLTGSFYPGYITLTAAPSFRLTPWLKAEGGLGTGITVASRFGSESNNDPLLLGLAGLRLPWHAWELNVRYYRFLRPLYKETTIRSERKYYSQGIQLGVTYYLLR